MAPELSDQELTTWLAQLDEAAMQELVASLNPHTTETPVDSQALERIERRALTQVRAGRSEPPSGTAFPDTASSERKSATRSRVPWKAAVTAAAGLCVLGLTVSHPNTVQAALRSLMLFVPGIGVAQAPNGTPVAVLPTPVFAKWHHHPVTVEGVFTTSRQIQVQLQGSGDQMPTTVALRIAHGRTVPLRLKTGGDGGGSWGGLYEAHGLFGVAGLVRSAIVMVGSKTPTHIGLRLQMAHAVGRVDQLGQTQFHHGISVTAIITRAADTASLFLVPQAHEPSLSLGDLTLVPQAYEPSLSLGDLTVTSRAKAGTHVIRTTLVQTWQPNIYHFAIPIASGYRVTLDSVTASYAGTTSMTLPVPHAGTEVVNRRTRLAGFPVLVTKVQRVTNDGTTYLRMYFGFSATRPLSVHPVSVGVVPAVWKGSLTEMSRTDPHTGTVIWTEMPVEPGQATLSVRLSGLGVAVPGPWTFNVTLPRVHT